MVRMSLEAGTISSTQTPDVVRITVVLGSGALIRLLAGSLGMSCHAHLCFLLCVRAKKVFKCMYY